MALALSIPHSAFKPSAEEPHAGSIPSRLWTSVPGDRAETGLVSVKVPIIWEETNFDFSICKKKEVGLHKQRLITL